MGDYKGIIYHIGYPEMNDDLTLNIGEKLRREQRLEEKIKKFKNNKNVYDQE